MRSRHASARELVSEAVTAGLFLVFAGPLAVGALSRHGVHLGLALVLVGLYALASRAVKFPVGAGYVMPSYLVLVPMLVLVPAGIAPLLAAAGLVLGAAGRVLGRRAHVEALVFSIADAWYTLGPALVLSVAGGVHGVALGGVWVAAFAAGCLVDLMASSGREWGAVGIAPGVQLRVVLVVWLINACVAPLGLLIAIAARRHPVELLIVVPLSALLWLVDRDRRARIEQGQRHLALVGRERTRLQAAVSRLGEAFAAQLDLPGLTAIALRGSIDALDGDAGELILDLPNRSPVVQRSGAASLAAITALARITVCMVACRRVRVIGPVRSHQASPPSRGARCDGMRGILHGQRPGSRMRIGGSGRSTIP